MIEMTPMVERKVTEFPCSHATYMKIQQRICRDKRGMFAENEMQYVETFWKQPAPDADLAPYRDPYLCVPVTNRAA